MDEFDDEFLKQPTEHKLRHKILILDSARFHDAQKWLKSQNAEI